MFTSPFSYFRVAYDLFIINVRIFFIQGDFELIYLTAGRDDASISLIWREESSIKSTRFYESRREYWKCYWAILIWCVN